MRSIEYAITGGPEVLTLVEGPVPDPGPGEVRVRIHRSGVNPTDWKSRRGSRNSGQGQSRVIAAYRRTDSTGSADVRAPSF